MVEFIDFLRNFVQGHGFVMGLALAGFYVIWH